MTNIIAIGQGKVENIIVNVMGVDTEMSAIKTEGLSMSGTKGYIYFVPTNRSF